MKGALGLMVLSLFCLIVPFAFEFGWFFSLSGCFILYFVSIRRASFFLTNSRNVVIVLVALGIMVFTICAKICAFEVYEVGTPSMEKTILVGDKVITNKLRHGPALPRSPLEIPWVNLFFSTNNAEHNHWGYRRLPGYGNIDHGDVLVFEHPRWNKVFIKRCVGLPGDTIEMRKGYLYVNNLEYEESQSLVRLYRVSVGQTKEFEMVLRNRGINGKWKSNGQFEVELTKSQALELSANKAVNSVTSVSIEYNKGHEVFPGPSNFFDPKWSIDEYGPYVVPKNGMKVPLNFKTHNHYWFLIKYREGNEEELVYRNGNFYLGEMVLTEYEFKKDYYFFLGDNRHNSIDSRSWGPIQEDMIIGVANTVLFSSKGASFWERFLKSIN